MKPKKYIFIIFFTISLLSISVLPASSGTLLYDDFDDGLLDPLWTISTDNVSDWTFEETGSELIVSDITPIEVNKWASVTFSQSFDPLSDFLIDFNFSWDSEGTKSAEQNITLSMYDTDDNKIGSVGYFDPWVYNQGSKEASIGSTSIMTVPNTMPLEGSAYVTILRTDDMINMTWDDSFLLSGSSSALLSRVDLEFSFYPNVGSRIGIFGTEAVDLIADPPPPQPIPEPGTLMLLGSGLAGLSLFRRKIHKK